MIRRIVALARRGAHRGARSIGRRRENRLVRGVAGLARTLVASYEGTDRDPYDIGSNGERWLLERLGPDLGVVFDVGANVGEWTATALEAGARAVHAFEIMPSTADLFAGSVGDDPRVILNRVGLGAADGTVTVHHYPDHPALTTTAIEFPHDLAHEERIVDVTTGDSYVERNEIDHIDLLKIDVEGEEPNVLAGFHRALGSGRVSTVQFEYGVVAVLERFLVADYFDLFDRHGFDVGPLSPAGVDFEGYSLDLERFQHPYFVAVHRSRPDLRRRLARATPERAD